MNFDDFLPILAGELLALFPGYQPPYHIKVVNNSISLIDASELILMGVPGTDPTVLAQRIVQKAAAIRMGSNSRSERKLSALQATRAKRREPAPCTCGQEVHKYTCPVYKRQIVAQGRAKKGTKNATH